MIKEQLQEYGMLKQEQAQILEELRALEARMTGPGGIPADGMPRGNAMGDPTARLVEQYDALVLRYRKQLTRLCRCQRETEERMEDLPPVERMLLRYRYLDGMKWEEVCDRMCYSWQQIHRIHRRALDRLEEQAQAAARRAG